MYKKKEVLILCTILLLIGIGLFIAYRPRKTNSVSEVLYEEKEAIVVRIEGEVVRPIEISLAREISYGILFMRIQYCLNEFSDLSSFDLEERITTSRTIQIPTTDRNNHYTPDTRIHINEASLMELMSLPQIGEKRGQLILDYIESTGKIKTWELFFEIAKVPEIAKNKIMEQAFL